MTNLVLPEREHIHATHEDDPLKYYYRPLTRYVYRKRLDMAISLLDGRRYGRLLDIGYGSGILLPTLAGLCDELVGIDIHDQVEMVKEMLALEGVEASLRQANLYDLPYADAEFDAVVCLSVMEHLTDLDGALHEMRRVARLNAPIVLGFPVRNVITSGFFRLVGHVPEELHPSSHRDILSVAQRAFDRVVAARFPAALPVDLSLYVVCRCVGS